ncbi:hypothetical protein LINPERHAP1_LOCUS5244 [Linum perenne]
MIKFLLPRRRRGFDYRYPPERIPDSFIAQHGHYLSRKLVFKSRHVDPSVVSVEWTTTGRAYFKLGWAEFVENNHIKHGSGMVFIFTGNLDVDVVVYHPSGSEMRGVDPSSGSGKRQVDPPSGSGGVNREVDPPSGSGGLFGNIGVKAEHVSERRQGMSSFESEI